jgi:lysophospholipase L1-like esterase
MKFTATKVIIFCLSTTLCSCINAKIVNPCDVKPGLHAAVSPVPKPNVDFWMPRHQAVLERNKQDNVDLIMIGDSITHRWEETGKEIWDRYYAKRNAVNMGFSGDRTQHVLWRMQNGEIDGINPKLAVLMIGTNNSNSKDSTAEQIADGIKAIVCELRNKLPNTKVLVLAIFPRGSAEQRKAKEVEAVYNWQWEKNDKASKLVSKIADNKMIYYLNINKAFLNKKGVLTRDIAPDLVHLSEKGYRIWAEAMEPTIVKMMKETK